MAGTLIQYLVTLLLNQQTKKRQKNALMKEFVYNRSLVDEFWIQQSYFCASKCLYDKRNAI
jgi:hypothetical protein